MAKTLIQSVYDNITCDGTTNLTSFSYTDEYSIEITLDASVVSGTDCCFFGFGEGPSAWSGKYRVTLHTDGTDYTSAKILIVCSTGSVSSVYSLNCDLSNIKILYNPNKGFYFNDTKIDDWQLTYSTGTDGVEPFNAWMKLLAVTSPNTLNFCFGPIADSCSGVIASANIYSMEDEDYPDYVAPVEIVAAKFVDYNGLKYYTSLLNEKFIKESDLSDYYTKTEIDETIGDIETLLSNI